MKFGLRQKILVPTVVVVTLVMLTSILVSGHSNQSGSGETMKAHTTPKRSPQKTHPLPESNKRLPG